MNIFIAGLNYNMSEAELGELQIIDESEVLDKLKKINDKNLVEEFNELIEMEEN